MDPNSSKLKGHQPIEGSWVPATPAQPGIGKKQPILEENRSQQSQFYQGNALQRSKTAATCYSQNNSINETAEFQSYEDTVYPFTGFHNVPVQNLLGHVMAGGTREDWERGHIHSALNADIWTSPVQCGLETESSSIPMENQTVFQISQASNVMGSLFPYDLNAPPSGRMGYASSARISSYFDPVTPDQTNKLEKGKSNMGMSLVEEGTKVQKQVAESFELQNNQSDLIENQTSATISSITGENFGPEMVIQGQTDPSKTPAAKSRRRKHRPKVIVEGQSRRTHKPRTPNPIGFKDVETPKRKYVRKNTVCQSMDVPSEAKSNGVEEAKTPHSEDMPKSKRKYVRGKKLEHPTTPMEDGITIPTDSSPDGVTQICCKEALNFVTTSTDSSADGVTRICCKKAQNVDNDSKMAKRSFSQPHSNTDRVTRSSCKKSLNFDIDSEVAEVSFSQPHSSTGRVTRSSCKKSLNFDIESKLPEVSFSQPHSSTDRVTRSSCKNSLNFDIENKVPEGSFNHSDIDPKLQEKEKELLVEKPANKVGCEFTQSTNHTLNDYLLVKESQAPCTSTSCMSSQFTAQNQCEGTRGKCRIVFSDVIHDDQLSIFKTMDSTVTPVTRSSSNSKRSSNTNLSEETEMRTSKRRQFSLTDVLKYSNLNTSGSRYNSLQAYQEVLLPNEYNRVPNLNFDFPAIYKRRTDTFHQPASSSILPPDTTVSSNILLPTFGSAGITKKRSKGITRVRNFQSLLGSLRQLQSQGPQTCMEALAHIRATVARKKRSNRNSSSSLANHHKKLLAIRTGTPPDIMWKFNSAIDAITEKFSCLNIEERGMVVYQNNGTMVRFDGSFNNARKRRPRPKVELDDETTRVWKLLLEDINSEGIDGTDQQKAKWWEGEREVFRLRTESFIARMHLVQGDRRFTPWKGSVVDSVVGVFLTQNVSDHLSSSAFISMAARFPLHSKNHNHNVHLCEKRSEGPEVLDPNDTMEWHNKVSSPLAGIKRSMTQKYSEEEINTQIFLGNTSKGTRTIHPSSLSSFTLECGAQCKEPNINGFTSRNNELLASFNGDQKGPDDVISSQNSVVSPHNSVESVGQTANRSESCSQSSTEAEPTDTASGFTSFVELLQMAETIPHGIYNQGCRKTSYFENPTKSEGAPYNFQSVNLGCQEINTCEDRIFGVFKETGLSVTGQSGSSPESSAGTSSQNVLSQNHQIPNEDRENELLSMVQKQETHRIYEGSNAPSSSESDFDNSGKNFMMERERSQKAVRTNLIDSHNLVDTAAEINASTSKEKKGNTNGKEQKDAIDWDALRKQALANGKRERTVETMDSVDWEAVRCADVKEIADTIKERGMNNMLAERIKDFLNRMVREHESIDLEWLRLVQPDRAKDFLLSIRGLGLKSVECVRLLTLHHLAFPVDTNVGRIAVRLGWVPLQPLPESLQLHLLELYPVLESIQKYLWPRLCKLDQPTLYELHYQMITFGKVFCTKSKPNCNACPMRAECRHFASAYASARLALPAPEERSVNPLQLTQPELNSHLEGSLQVRSIAPIIEEPATPEPIIEEPATPEPEKTQVPDIDIEDTLREDAAEIPTIKLNLEELNQTLQNYIQKNIQVQEGEMSKALVVLDAGAASIPTPKLKSINRLRTEHQVYELPDTHPLLQGFDRRELDDPSHYLLAIWTPGETVNSIQPPESTCSFQDSGNLCDQETCFSCNSIREANTQTVRGTILIPCRTAMRGSFPLNGTYFQVNEMFADHESSLNPIDVPRDWLWNLNRRTVFFGTSIPTIFKGLSQPDIQYCFWKGFVCVRGFDRKSRAPRPLVARLHFPASKLMRARGRTDE